MKKKYRILSYIKAGRAFRYLLPMLFAIAAGLIWLFFIPSRTQVDPAAYYGSDSDDRYPVIADGSSTGICAVFSDGEYYVPLSYVKANWNDRFYEEQDGTVRYAEPLTVKTYSSENLLTVDGELQLSMSVIADETEMTWSVDSEGLLVVQTSFENPAVFDSTTKDTVLRTDAGIHHRVLADLPADSRVRILEEGRTWSLVQTEDGIPGYVKNSALSGTRESVQETAEHPGLTYSSKSFGGTIVLGWNYIDDVSYGLDSLKNCLANNTSANVVSPTWVMLKGADGDFDYHGDSAYVEYAHSQGVEVWVLVENMTNDADMASLLNSPEARDHLVEGLMEKAEEDGFDGINLDIEELSSDLGPAYLEFIRELSASCRAADLYLSVDNYVPKAWTRFYDREEQGEIVDYVIVMGYDEHYYGQDEAGPTASLSFVRDGIEDTMDEVPAEKVVIAVPFYSRLWKWTPEAQADGVGVAVTDDELGDCRLTSTTKSMIACEEIEEEHSGTWDEELGLSHISWMEDGCRYEIWPEDEQSMEARLSMASGYDIAGIACWMLGTEPAEVWNIVREYYDTGR